MNPELNLEPNAILNASFARLHAGDFNVNAMIAQALTRAADAAQGNVVRIAQGSRTNAGVAHLNWNWVHGLDFPFVESIKIVSFILTLIFAIVFISLWLRTYTLHKPDRSVVEQIAPPEPAAGGPLSARWEEIQRHLDSVRETEWKFAVMEADKLVDDSLRKAGFVGDTFADRLERVQPGQIAYLDALWAAHRLRNRVAHEVNYFLRYTEAKHAIDAYGSVLRELGAIA